MVTEVNGRPTPKVIDFGVAKATEANLTDQSLGDTGAIVGTPTYMSPEQADPSSMDIDTRTDVYALGVILYELLAGSPPLDATQFKRGALLEMLRMVREVNPSKPSTKVSTADALPSIAANRATEPDRLKRALRGDLDWIVMKALEKDRTRRYETANGLGADILRHLASEPVLAAPPSRSYRARKFVRKHRAGVIAASLVLLALVAGVAGTTWGLFEAQRSADAERRAKLDALEKKKLAEENAKKALAAAEEEKKAKETVEDVLGFVETRVFAAARPKDQEGGLGYDVTLADAIKAALPAIQQGFAGKPLTEARLRRTIGLSFYHLGKPEIAMGQFKTALALQRRELGPDHPDTLETMNRLAASYFTFGWHAGGLKLFEETLAVMKARLGADHPDTLASMDNLATIYLTLGRPAGALKLREETLALMKARLGPDHPDTLASMDNLATIYLTLGRPAGALKLREETLAVMKAKLGADHPNTFSCMDDLAACYAALGRQAEALSLREKTLLLKKAKLGADHPDTLESMRDLGDTYTALGRHADALKLHEKALALWTARLGPDHRATLLSMENLVRSYLAAGRTPEALSLLETYSAARPSNSMYSMKLAALQVWFGRDKEFAVTRRRILQNAQGTRFPYTAERVAKVCSLLPSVNIAELDAAIGFGRRAVDLGKDDAYLAFFLMSLGMAEYRRGHFAEAETSLAAANDHTKSSPNVVNGFNDIVNGTSAFYRAMCLFRQGKKDEARTLATEAAAKMKPLPRDEQNPLASGATHDELILWLACKEAKALIGFDTPPATPKPDGK